MSPEEKKKVVIVVGPTAVGKTRLSIELAQRIDGEIVSADSRYLYRGMDIGSAKPSMEERMGVPHHLIDVANPDETWSLAQFSAQAKLIINEILSRKRVPIVVGGTGQYIRALTEGWSVPVMEPNPDLRIVLSTWAEEIGAQSLYQKLAILDPEALKFIDAPNVRRTIRALEVIFTTGQKFSDQRQKNPPDYQFWIVGLIRQRPELYALVDQRIENMFQQGLVDEVKLLMERGYNEELPSMSAIGYREVVQFVHGKLPLIEAKALMRHNTRQFIRRQANWFKPTDTNIHWYSMETNPVEKIVDDVNENFLKGNSLGK